MPACHSIVELVVAEVQVRLESALSCDESLLEAANPPRLREPDFEKMVMETGIGNQTLVHSILEV